MMGMHTGMGWGMGIGTAAIWLLTVLVFVLAAGALVKYLRS